MHYGRGAHVRFTFDPSRPIYQQIIDEIRRRIARGELAPGDRIPSQRELAEMVKVNPNTIQRAYREMEQSGLVETLRGQGTFIRQDPSMVESIREEMAAVALAGFVQEMRALGYTLQATLDLVREAYQGDERGSEDGSR